MKRSRKYLLALSALFFAVAVFGQSRPRTSAECPEKMPETYSIKTFLTPDWELAMHEVFTHYLQAASTFGQGNYEMTIAFLKCMEFYVNMLPNIIPDTTPPPENKPINKAQFRKSIEELRVNTVQLRKAVEAKDYKQATNMAPEFVTKLCFDCHKKAKVAPRWQMGGYKIDE